MDNLNKLNKISKVNFIKSIKDKERKILEYFTINKKSNLEQKIPKIKKRTKKHKIIQKEHINDQTKDQTKDQSKDNTESDNKLISKAKLTKTTHLLTDDKPNVVKMD